MAISPQWLDELRARTTLSSLIGQSVKIQKAGNEYKACCPFHNEKTPSFYINDAKGFYHCFGCSAHGDAIRWMTDYRGLGFIDAVKELADAANMEVPRADPREAKRQEQRATLHDVMADAAEWFTEQLQSSAGAGAREYLTKRGINPGTLQSFGFGFAPDSRGALKEALAKHGDEKLVEAGLLISVDGKRPYDRFRGRLMIPIRDPRGRVIAFGGRILGDGEPKYLNSPDTPLFDKGRTLYNYDRAAKASRQTGRLIVVEGYMDAIALSQAGFEDVVAPLGTALTETQLELCWKLADKPIICLDGDAAGQRAAGKAIGRALPVLRPPRSLRFIKLPAGLDPDDLIKRDGKTGMARAVEEAQGLADTIWQNELTLAGPNPGPDERAALLQRVEDTCREIGDQKISSEYQRHLKSLFFDQFGFKRPKFDQLRQVIRKAHENPGRGVRNLIHRAILLGVMRYPQCLANRFEDLGKLPIDDGPLQELRSLLMDLVMEYPDLDEDLIEKILQEQELTPPEKRDLTRDLGFSFYQQKENPEQPLEDLNAIISAILDQEARSRALSEARELLSRQFDEESLEIVRAAEAAKRASDEALEVFSARLMEEAD